MSKESVFAKTADYFRMWLWPLAAIILLIWLGRPEQVPVLMYKAIMVSVAVWIGYWADRNLFGTTGAGRLVPSMEWNFAKAVMFRRAIVVAAVVLAFCIGL